MNIIISGLTCSGKTTLSNEIYNQNNNTCILREDDYMKDKTFIPHKGKFYLMDLPRAYNIEEYLNDIDRLLREGLCYYPLYDFNINKRINKNELKERKEINIFEGLHTIELLKDLRDSIKVFMDTDIDTCLERRIIRDTNVYKAQERQVREYFNEVILPIYKTHIECQRDLSDVVIRKEDDKKCFLKKLQTYY